MTNHLRGAVRVEEPAGAAALTGWAWRLYMANWRPVLAISAAAAAARWLLGVTTGQPMRMPHGFGLGGATVNVPAPWAALLGAALALWAGATILNFFGGTPDAQRTTGGALAACARVGLLRLWPLFVTGLVMGVVGGVGIVLLVVPGVYVLTRWAVAPAIAVIEGRPAAAALGRSAALTAGHFWHALGTVLLGFLAASAASAVATGIGTAILRGLGLTAPAGISLWADLVASAASPWTLALIVALYDDLVLRGNRA